MSNQDHEWREYERQVNEKCSLSIQEHNDMLMCWGLLNAVRHGREMICTGCEFYKLKHQHGHPITK